MENRGVLYIVAFMGDMGWMMAGTEHLHCIYRFGEG
jgi:hypothetical protein